MTQDDLKALPPERGTAVCNVVRIQADQPTVRVSDRVISEEAVTVMVDQVGSFTLLCTPSDLEALAVGFAFSEGLIDDAGDVIDIAQKPSLPHVIGLRIQDPSRISERRNMIVASACGMCGVRNIEKLLTDMPVCGNTLRLSSHVISEVVEKLQTRQDLFRMTGGSHAAGVFDAKGDIITFAEDLGRHNALDKAIGKCLLESRSPKGCGVALSGRVSLEMVTKAARAGMEIIAAVSAPSSVAVHSADTWNITLCGFVRSGRINVYTHEERIVAAGEKTGHPY